MIFTNEVYIFLLSLAGSWVAWHIRKHKKEERPLICPFKLDCDKVVRSEFSTLFGIHLEVYGMLYYALVALFYLYLVITNTAVPALVLKLFQAATLGAFLFSLYLTYVQIFRLKKGCSWCILSAIISVSIFILTVV